MNLGMFVALFFISSLAVAVESSSEAVASPTLALTAKDPVTLKTVSKISNPSSPPAAGEPVTAPKVQCDLTYRKFSEAGEAEVYGSAILDVTEAGSSVEDNGFILAGHLRQNCAADGGPCSGSFGLTVTITKGNSEGYLNANAQPTGYDRYSAGLKVENETALVNCVKFPPLLAPKSVTAEVSAAVAVEVK